LQLDLIDQLEHHVRLRGERIAAETPQLTSRTSQRVQLCLTQVAAIHAVGEIANAIAELASLTCERAAPVFEAAERDARHVGIPCSKSAARLLARTQAILRGTLAATLTFLTLSALLALSTLLALLALFAFLTLLAFLALLPLLAILRSPAFLVALALLVPLA
jgi:hypothetical protein